MSEERLPTYIRQMREAVDDALRYADGLTEVDFLDDELRRRAVILCLLIIGEAAAKIMDNHPDFAAWHVNIPWRAMRGMRNRIAHRYFDVDLAVVWKTIQNELPYLAEALGAMGQ